MRFWDTYPTANNIGDKAKCIWHNCNHRAFTMIEILIMTALIACVALLAVPMVTSAGNIRINTAANTIVADLEYVRCLAIKNRTKYSVIFDASEDEYRVFRQDSENNIPVAHPARKNEDYCVELSNRSIDIKAHDVIITFDAMGNTISSGNIMIAPKQAKQKNGLTINVGSRTGHITVVESLMDNTDG